MNHNGYIERKQAGLVRFAKTADGYVLQTRQWERDNGNEGTAASAIVSLADLNARKLGLQESLRQLNRMITDLTAFATANPL